MSCRAYVHTVQHIISLRSLPAPVRQLLLLLLLLLAWPSCHAFRLTILRCRVCVFVCVYYLLASSAPSDLRMKIEVRQPKARRKRTSAFLSVETIIYGCLKFLLF